jgi:hypothetical protein
VTQIFVLKSSRADWDRELYRRASQDGAAEGAAGRPGADATTIDGVESRLHSEVRERVLAVNGLLAGELNRVNPLLAAQRAELTAREHLFNTRHSCEVSRQTFENVLTGRRSQLAEAFQRRHAAEGHYNLFRFVNGIVHAPDHPKDRLNYLSWIFLILAFETLLNAVFWTGSMGGFLSTALLISFVLSAINIGIGFSSGALFSYKNLRHIQYRVLGWSSLVGGIALSCLVNYYIITHRSTAEAFGGGNMGESINNILSLAMFAVGVGFAMFALYKGSRFFGSVPGYESAARQYLEALQDVAGITRQARDELQAERRAQEDLRRRLIGGCGELKVTASQLIADIQNVRAQYTLVLDRLDDVLKQCVKAYRDANRAVRAARAASPAYFAQTVDQLGRDTQGLDSIEQAVRAHLAEIEARAQVIQETSASEIGKVRELATHYVGARLNEWTEAADKEGLRRHEESVRALECDARSLA